MAENTERFILYVGGLSEEVDQKVMLAAFIPFGEVKSIELPIDLANRIYIIIIVFIIEKHKGFGFVEYEEYEDCLHAIDNMNDSEIYGKVIRVSFAKAQKIKEGYHKPIWTVEGYNNTLTADQFNSNDDNKKAFE